MHYQDICDSMIFSTLINWKKNHLEDSFKKGQFSQKLLIIEHRDYFFFIPRVISDRKHPVLIKKNFF